MTRVNKKRVKENLERRMAEVKKLKSFYLNEKLKNKLAKNQQKKTKAIKESASVASLKTNSVKIRNNRKSGFRISNPKSQKAKTLEKASARNKFVREFSPVRKENIKTVFSWLELRDGRKAETFYMKNGFNNGSKFGETTATRFGKTSSKIQTKKLPFHSKFFILILVNTKSEFLKSLQKSLNNNSTFLLKRKLGTISRSHLKLNKKFVTQNTNFFENINKLESFYQGHISDRKQLHFLPKENRPDSHSHRNDSLMNTSQRETFGKTQNLGNRIKQVLEEEKEEEPIEGRLRPEHKRILENLKLL